MPRPSSARPCDPALAQIALSAVSLEFGLPGLALTYDGRRLPDIVFARQVAIYLVHCVFAMKPNQIARHFGRDPSTISHAISVIETQRETPVLCDKIARLERWLADVPRGPVCPDMSQGNPNQELEAIFDQLFPPSKDESPGNKSDSYRGRAA